MGYSDVILVLGALDLDINRLLDVCSLDYVKGGSANAPRRVNGNINGVLIFSSHVVGILSLLGLRGKNTGILCACNRGHVLAGVVFYSSVYTACHWRRGVNAE